MIGSGTAQDPYLLESSEDLNKLRNNLAGYYKQVADIDLVGIDWKPVGIYSAPFTGHFDGNGHTIRNLNVHATNWETGAARYGLFGYAEEATLNNIVLIDASVTFKADSGVFLNGLGFGALGGELIRCSVYRCSMNGVVSVRLDNQHDIKTNAASNPTGGIGGLIGIIRGTKVRESFAISDVYYSVTANGGTYITPMGAGVGGLVGVNRTIDYPSDSIENCYSISNVHADIRLVRSRYFTMGYHVGVHGILGYAEGYKAYLTNVYTVSNVSYNVTREREISGETTYLPNFQLYEGPTSGSIRIHTIEMANVYFEGVYEGYKETIFESDGSIRVLYYTMDDNSGIYARDGSSMRQQTTFVNWNFTDIWEIDNGVDYPRLRWQIYTRIDCVSIPLPMPIRLMLSI